MREAILECYNAKGEVVYSKPLSEVVVSSEEKIIIPF